MKLIKRKNLLFIKINNRYLYVPYRLSWIDPFHFYTKGGHYYLTKFVMKEFKINRKLIADTIKGNIGVDTHLSGRLFRNFHSYKDVIDNSMLYVELDLKLAIKKLSYKHLGRALHIIQDKWAHAEQNADIVEHLPFIGTDPDNPVKHIRNYYKAYKDSRKLLVRFLNALKNVNIYKNNC